MIDQARIEKAKAAGAPVAVVPVPVPAMTDYEKENFAIETAFSEMVNEARDLGLRVAPATGLMYLPTQKLTRDFQDAGRAILRALAKEAQ